MLKNLFSKKESGKEKTQIEGIIGYLGLESFWLSCTNEEQEALTRYYKGGVGTGPNESPIKGKISFSSETKLGYFFSMLGWATSEKNYTLADKIISDGSAVSIDDASILDAHYFWQEVAECYYKQRDIRPDAINLAIQFCSTDIAMFPKFKTPMIKEFGSVPNITTFQRLAIIYEKSGEYEKAIEVCKLAIEYELSDSTKGGYPARLEKLKKKLNG